MMLALAMAYSDSAPPATGVTPAQPKTSWPGSSGELDAGVTIVPAKSIDGVAGVVMAKRVIPGNSAAL